MTDKIKVLMVDDEEQFRATTSRLLSKKGYETTVAGTAGDALDILRHSRQDVVILDIKMPGMDGHQALSEIKKIQPDTQVIMLTGFGTPESAKASLKKAAFDYLNKPCDIDLLDLKIKEAHSAAHKPGRAERSVKEVMIPIDEYSTIDSDQTVREGIERLKHSYESVLSTGRLLQFPHHSLVVFDQNRAVVGMLSIRDLIQALLPSYLFAPRPSMAYSMEYSAIFWKGLFVEQAKSLGDKKVADVMSGPPPSVDEETNLMEIASLMYHKQVPRVVVSCKGRVIGIVREQELLFELSRLLLES